MLWWVPAADQMRVFVAGVAGILLYLGVDFVASLFESEESSDPAVAMVHRAGFGGFLYLEVLDASFSFDGVIGAFKGFKKDGLAGLIPGIIAQILSSLTFGLVKFDTIYKFLKKILDI